MGKTSSNQTSNSPFRKPPPSLSKPGAQHCGGSDLEFGAGTQQQHGMPSSKMGVDQRIAAERQKKAAYATIARVKSDRSNTGTDTTGTDTESSLQEGAGPTRIPLEVDHFNQTKPESKLHWIIPAVLMVITAILAVVIPVAVIMSREKVVVKRPENTPAPIPVKANITLAELQELVPGSNEAMLKTILEDKHSPQYLALEWVRKDPYNWEEYEDWRKIQRYAMTVLFYSLDGFRWPSHHYHECNWLDIHPGVEDICDSEQRFFNLHLPRHNLPGVLPGEVAMLPHLQIIDLTTSYLGENIDNLFSVLLEEDQELSHFLPSLDTLILSDFELVGTIPTFLTALPKLSHLDFSQNGMSSAIPSELGLLTNLDTLILSGNKFTGVVPSELGALSLLSTFAIEENQLEQGPLPEAMCSDDHAAWIRLETDWCQSSDHCCMLK